MSLAVSSTPSRLALIGLWVLRGILAVVFLGAGGAKLYGVPMLVEEFQRIGLGEWFRYFTGTLEVIGACLLLTPSLVVFGAMLLSCVMVGATIAHLFVIGGSPVPALVLLSSNAVVIYARRGDIAAKLGRARVDASLPR